MPESSVTALDTACLDAQGLHYRELNARLREVVNNGVRSVSLHNVCGQRYIGTGLREEVELHIYGTPGNDLGAFMDGPRIIVHGNAQDGCGNTMNRGEIIVHGHAGDILGLSTRGGRIFVRDDVGYRVGIHMKEYQEQKPVLVIGGTAQDFLGEYMAGGILLVLGLNLAEGHPHFARFIGTGMHGGVIYLRGSVKDHQLGKEVGVSALSEADWTLVKGLVEEYSACFGTEAGSILQGSFLKLTPRYLRPYGRLYAY